MSANPNWLPAEPDLPTVLACYPDPVAALAAAEIPAIVLRQVYDPAMGAGLIQRFLRWGLMRDPTVLNAADGRKRIDIGTSLGNRGSARRTSSGTLKARMNSFPTCLRGLPIR
jgi:hypothetical protein